MAGDRIQQVSLPRAERDLVTAEHLYLDLERFGLCHGREDSPRPAKAATWFSEGRRVSQCGTGRR